MSCTLYPPFRYIDRTVCRVDALTITLLVYRGTDVAKSSGVLRSLDESIRCSIRYPDDI